MHVTRRKRGVPPVTTAPRLLQAVVTAVLRRRGILLAVPLLYLSAILVLVGKWGLEGAPPAVVVGVTTAFRRRHVPAPGSVYKSSQVFQKLWPMMEADSNHTNAVRFKNFNFFYFFPLSKEFNYYFFTLIYGGKVWPFLPFCVVIHTRSYTASLFFDQLWYF